MKLFLVLPLADAKTIRVDPPVEPLVSNLGPEAAVAIGLLVLILAVLFLLPRLWRLFRPQPRFVQEDWVLIDGSNVMHWRDNTPSLETIRKVVDLVRALGYTPGVVFDANAGWKLVGRYLHDGDFAGLLGLEKRQVLVVANGTQADPFLLKTANEFGARIITNDRFRDWSEDHPEVLQPGFLVRGGMRGDELQLDGLPQRESKAGSAAKDG